MGYIYKITNIINNKCYIGQTTRNIQERWKEHLSRLENKNKFYNAIKFYGIENFIISQVEECPNELLNEREIFWIKFYDSYESGYNSTGGGEGGIKITPSKVKKIIQLYQEGFCIRDIRVILNSSIETVSFYLKQELNLTDEDIKRNGYTISSNKLCKSVIQLDLNGNFINQFNSYKEAEEKTGACRTHIGAVCNGKRKTAGGYKWKKLKNYLEDE